MYSIIKKRLIAACAGIFFLLLFVAVTAIRFSAQPVIGFYGLSDNQITALTTAMNGQKVRCRFFSSERPIADQLAAGQKPDMLIMRTGIEANYLTQNLQKKHSGIPGSILSGMTPSIKKTAVLSPKGSVIQCPLLYDHQEIAIDSQLQIASGVKTIATWHDIEQYARAAQRKKRVSVVFAGSNSSTIFSILGALTESLDGRRAYEKAVTLMGTTSGTGSARAAALAGTPDAPLYHAVRFLAGWYQEKLIASEVFSLTEKDIASRMETGQASVAFIMLSDHLALSTETATRYTALYFPSEQPASTRSFTAPEICAIALSQNKKNKIIAALLTAPGTQQQLSKQTNLTPVLAHTRISAYQADDARFWVDATDIPVNGLAADLFSNRSIQDDTAQALIALITEKKE